MKITGPGPIRTTAEAGRLRKKAPKDADFAKELDSGGSEPVAKAAGQTRVTSVDALLALQEVPDATARRSAGVRRAEDILDRLNEVRIGLLEGSIPRERLHQLLDMVRKRREAIDDPKLSAVLDEIELRAAVELAKLGEL